MGMQPAAGVFIKLALAQAPVEGGRSRRQRRGIAITRVMLTATGAVLGLLRAWQRHCGSSCTMLPRLAQQVSAGTAEVPSMKGRHGRRRKRSVLQVDVPPWGTARTPATETSSSSSATLNAGADAIASRWMETGGNCFLDLFLW